MSDTSPNVAPAAPGVLARIIAAHSRQAATARDRSPQLSAAWEKALRHAAVPFRGLDLAPNETRVLEHARLSDALGLLPDHGLIAVLEEPSGARGIIAISHGAVDALVEVQTTGRVDAQELPARPVTRIDEALSRDFLDLSLAAFSRECQAMVDRDWPERLRFGSRIADRPQLNLLLADGNYHAMASTVALGAEGARVGYITLVIPRTKAVVATEGSDTAADNDPSWRATLEAELAQVDVHLSAVLLRTTRPLREVEALAPGDLIDFAASDLGNIRLEAPGGRRMLGGRLGQMNGHRAVRLADPGPTAVTPQASSNADALSAMPSIPAAGPASLAPDAAAYDPMAGASAPGDGQVAPEPVDASAFPPTQAPGEIADAPPLAPMPAPIDIATDDGAPST